MSFSPNSNRRNFNPNGRNRTTFSPNRRDLSPPPFNNNNFNNNNISGNRNSRPRRQVNNETSTFIETSKPLLEPDLNNQSATPPLAGPEIDDLEPDDRETINKNQPGVDDGFFSNSGEHPDAETIPQNPPPPPPKNNPEIPEDPINDPGTDDTDLGRYPANYPRVPDFPYAPGFGAPDVFNVNFPEYPQTEVGSESIPDVNVYQHKKTLAQGMMDIALFSANANQLRYVLESYDRHPYYYPSIVLITFSLLLQIAVGVGLIWNSRYNVKDKKEICIANKINNFTIIGIFLCVVINVFISAFGVANAPSTVLAIRSSVDTESL